LFVGAVGTFCTLIAPDSFIGDCLVNFPYQLILALTIGGFSYKRIGLRLAGPIVCLGIFLNLLTIYNSAPKISETIDNQECPQLKIGSFNLLSKNRSYAAVAKEIQEQNFDLILFQEFTDHWGEGLKEELDKYPERVTMTRSDDFGSGIFSKFPALNKEAIRLASVDPETLVMTLVHCSAPVAIVNLHTLPPASPTQWRVRNQQLQTLAQMVSDTSKRWIVMGDFNATPYSTFLRKFRTDSGLSDARARLGFIPSWPTFMPLLWIPIDQVFYSGSLQLIDIQRGSFIGSDHWPLYATFR
jgi:endonuclease/exonuclease/phosphatase (EEP) superfamily protein YafD